MAPPPRPGRKLRSEKAAVYRLSPSLDAILSGRGALTLIRSDKVFHLNDREASLLWVAILEFRPAESRSPREEG